MQSCAASFPYYKREPGNEASAVGGLMGGANYFWRATMRLRDSGTADLDVKFSCISCLSLIVGSIRHLVALLYAATCQHRPLVCYHGYHSWS